MHGAPRAGHSRSNLNSLHVLDLSWWISCYHTISLLIICSKKTHGHRTQCCTVWLTFTVSNAQNGPLMLGRYQLSILFVGDWNLCIDYCPPFFSSPSIWLWQLFNVHVSFKKKKRAAAQVATVSINLFAPASALLTSLLGCLCHDVGWLTVETLISGEHGWTWEFDQLLPCFIAEQHQNLPVSNHGVWPGG